MVLSVQRLTSFKAEILTIAFGRFGGQDQKLMEFNINIQNYFISFAQRALFPPFPYFIFIPSEVLFYLKNGLLQIRFTKSHCTPEKKNDSRDNNNCTQCSKVACILFLCCVVLVRLIRLKVEPPQDNLPQEIQKVLKSPLRWRTYLRLRCRGNFSIT